MWCKLCFLRKSVKVYQISKIIKASKYNCSISQTYKNKLTVPGDKSQSYHRIRLEPHLTPHLFMILVRIIICIVSALTSFCNQPHHANNDTSRNDRLTTDFGCRQYFWHFENLESNFRRTRILYWMRQTTASCIGTPVCRVFF